MNLLQRIKENVSQNGGGRVSIVKIKPFCYEDNIKIDQGYKRLKISLVQSNAFNNLNQQFIDSLKVWISKANPEGCKHQHLFSFWSISCDHYDLVIVNRDSIETLYIKKKSIKNK